MANFRVLTYNIWFDQEDQDIRLIELLKTIKQLQNDNVYPLLVIAFQEVTHNVFSQLFIEMKRMGYNLCTSLLSIEKPYFDLLFVLDCVPVQDQGHSVFENTQQGRTLSWVTLEFNEELITFQTSHLESLPQQQNKRISQIDIIQNSHNHFPDSSACIFMGDTNFHDYNDSLIAKPWHDTWIEKGTDDNKYTYDKINNKYVKTRRSRNARFDRIYYYGKVEPIDFNLVGKTLIDDQSDDYIEISDHYGIVAEFQAK